MKKMFGNKIGNLNKKALIGIGLAVVLVAAVIVVSINSGSDDKKIVATTDKNKDVACKVLQFNDAHTVLGDTIQQDPVKASTTSTQDVGVSTCIYRQAGAAADNNKLIASLVVNIPLTSDGKAANKKVFEGKTLNGLKQSPYGKAAFWDAQGGKLNILKKDGTWYVLSFGQFKPVDRNLSQTEELADRLIPRFN